MAFHQKGHLDQAQSIYEEILETAPDHFDALHLLGVIAAQTRNHQRAVDLMGRAIDVFPHDPSCYFNRGLAFRELMQWDAAAASFSRAIALRPDYVEAWLSRGLVLQGAKRLREAIADYEQSIALKPDNAEAWLNRGVALGDLRELKAALASYDRAIALKPDYPEAWYNRGIALQGLKQTEAALASYDRAIELKPDFAEAWSNRGIAFQGVDELASAIDSYDRAIELKPDYFEMYLNRGDALKELKLFDAAADSYEKASSLNPACDFLPGGYLHIKMMACDWSSFDELLNLLVVKIMGHERASKPFPVLSMSGLLTVTGQAALMYAAEKYPPCDILGEIVKRPRHERIRVGYYSADFHDHATMHLMAEFFEKHDRSKFELMAFSFGPERKADVVRQRVVRAFDRFIDVGGVSDREVAAMSRELEVDIAVDLKGYTKDSRTDIFAFRAAPIQVNYLGYPGTMGAGYIDYIIADHTLIPEGFQQFYTEKAVYLPGSYQANDSTRRIADRVFTREEEGLPPTGFVFCCFNNNYKITPAVFDSWMRILERVEGAVLWLYEDNPKAAGNLRKEAVRRGVDAGRLIFARRMPLAEHLARHRLADLFLDTLPYNAHTTASDALWAGLPLLTQIGESFAGRVAASLLNAIGLPELITSSPEAYEALAIELATRPEKLAAIKLKLDANRLTAPLFDSDRFVGNFEAAYEKMYERYQLDLPPAHIYLQ
ncbi:MAG: tetratricopeptide repeat protein [Chlorobiaceae bacterium]|nr:tetratricopeptide repeat protein [Chlorobiaceae bacterium]